MPDTVALTVAVSFALPLAHRTDGNYGAFAGALARGRPFRQPLETQPSGAGSSRGLELYSSAAGEVAGLFAAFDGELRWEPSDDGTSGNRLTLTPATGVLRRGYAPRLDTIEAPPALVIYDNVDDDAFQLALETLLARAYAVAAGRPKRPAEWHPAMQMRVRGDGQSLRLKHLLDRRQVGADSSAPEIVRIVSAFLSGQSGETLVGDFLPVRAGDQIGRAACHLAGEQPPPPLDDSATRVTLIFEDGCGQLVDPLHYLNRLLQTAFADRTLPATKRRAVSITTIVVSGQLAHPLVALCPELGQATAPRGRAQVSDRIPFPIGSLSEFHGFPRSSPAGSYEWRYADDAAIEGRRRDDHTKPAPLTPQQNPHKQRVSALWAAHGPAIAAISDALQIPTAVIAALICTEALPSLSPRSVRLEPLRPADRLRVRADAVAAPLETQYDKAVGIRGDVSGIVDEDASGTSFDIELDSARSWEPGVLSGRSTWLLWGTQRRRVRRNNGDGTSRTGFSLTIEPAPLDADAMEDPNEAWVLEGYSPPDPGVPDPWTGGSPVRAGETLTWSQLVTVVNATRGERISPGIIQTLISTARAIVPWLRAARPTIFGDLGIANPPAAAGGYLNDWLLRGTNSILVGAAYVRSGYNTHLTGFDLPLVAGAYNAGAPKIAAGSDWGLLYHGRYIERAGPFMNAAAAMFAAQPEPTPPAPVLFVR